MGEGSKEEVWSSERWPIYFEALVVLHSSAQEGRHKRKYPTRVPRKG